MPPDPAAHSPPPGPVPKPRPGPRVLLVRPSALGDVSRTVPALVTLRRAMPEAHIDWLVNEAFADAVRHHPDLDGLVIFPRGRFAHAYRDPKVVCEAAAWGRTLGRAGYDIAIDLQGLFRSGLFTRLTGAPRRIGYANARELAWLGYNRRHHVDRALHAVDRMLGLLAAEGFAPVVDMRLYAGQEEQRWLEGLLAQHGVARGYAVVAPLTRWPSKCWPLPNYVQIIRRLLKSGAAGEHVLVLASPGERQQLAAAWGPLAQNSRVIFPPTTVGQMMVILRRATLVICNDSGPLHIAVGFDRPVVAIFGPTDPALVGPYRRSDTLVRPPGVGALGPRDYRRYDQSLIAQVSVDTVWEKAQEQLARRRGE